MFVYDDIYIGIYYRVIYMYESMNVFMYLGMPVCTYVCMCLSLSLSLSLYIYVRAAWVGQALGKGGDHQISTVVNYGNMKDDRNEINPTTET